MYVYVYLFCNCCVITSEILLECALQVYWKFGWICSHPVKSRVKNSWSRQICCFSLHREWHTNAPGCCLCRYTYLVESQLFLAHRDFDFVSLEYYWLLIYWGASSL